MVTRLSPADVIIGRNIRKLRQFRGWSQGALAEKLGLTFQQVQKYEKGTNRVAGSRIVQLCDVLSCDLAMLFDGTARTQDPFAFDDPSRDMMGTKQGIRTAEAFNQLPLALKDKVAEFAEALVGAINK